MNEVEYHLIRECDSACMFTPHNTPSDPFKGGNLEVEEQLW